MVLKHHPNSISLPVLAMLTLTPRQVTPGIIAAAVKGSQWAYSESLKYVW